MSKEKAKNKDERNKELDELEKAFRTFIAEFKDESDRAVVIIGSAKLDYSLYQILSKYFVPNVSGSDELLEGDSPLSTFSAKINICYRLGLIDSTFARALHLTRRIRNSFAHEVSGGRLDTGSHKDRVKELIAPFAQTVAYKDLRKIYFEDKTGTTGNFLTILGLMVLRLDTLFRKLPPISPTIQCTLIPSGYSESVFNESEEATTTSEN
jgi:hypothetical protein